MGDTKQRSVHITRGGDGFFLAREDFGRMFHYSFPVGAFFFFFCKAEISSRTLIQIFMPGSVHSGSASNA